MRRMHEQKDELKSPENRRRNCTVSRIAEQHSRKVDFAGSKFTPKYRCHELSFDYSTSLPTKRDATRQRSRRAIEESEMLQEIRLLTPGPLALAPEIKAAMQFDLGSRDHAFREVTRDIRRMILELAGADRFHSVIPVQGSGTFAIEAVLTTFIKPADKVLVCVNGIYGEL